MSLLELLPDQTLLTWWRIAVADGGKLIFGFLALSGLYTFIKEVSGLHSISAPAGPPYTPVITWKRRRVQAVALGWIIVFLAVVLPIGYTHAMVTLPKELEPPLARGLRYEMIAVFVGTPLFVVLQILFYLRLGSVKPVPK